MKRLLLIVALVVVGCNPSANTDDSPSGTAVYYWHDSAHRVSCWLYGGAGNTGKGIACIPDSEVTLP